MSKWITYKCSICEREEVCPEMLHLEGTVPEDMIKMKSLIHNKHVSVTICFRCLEKFRDALTALSSKVKKEEEES